MCLHSENLYFRWNEKRKIKKKSFDRTVMLQYFINSNWHSFWCLSCLEIAVQKKKFIPHVCVCFHETITEAKHSKSQSTNDVGLFYLLICYCFFVFLILRDPLIESPPEMNPVAFVGSAPKCCNCRTMAVYAQLLSRKHGFFTPVRTLSNVLLVETKQEKSGNGRSDCARKWAHIRKSRNSFRGQDKCESLVCIIRALNKWLPAKINSRQKTTAKLHFS